jgi:2-polyprenyl-3-methyl-5-hydroxy-6-metoxy-1,4-benzoquinol methylase
MKALEYGAGTALLSLLLRDNVGEITLMDSSEGMIGIMREKITQGGIENLFPVLFDLEKDTFPGKFDLIFNQMVFHHVADIDSILGKFHEMLNPEGFLAIADLYPEDGSFHGEGFTGHKGFDPHRLSEQLANAGFVNVRHQPCFVIKKMDGTGIETGYPVFLMTAGK